MYIDFARPELLLLLTLLPLWAIAARQGLGTGVMYSGGDPSGLHQHATVGGRFFLLLPNVLSGTTMALLIVALAGPQSIEIVPRTAPRGAGIALAVDLSTSMLAEDMEGRSRLDVARDAASLFAEMRADDELALVAFAGHALTRIPPTYDERLVLSGIESLDPDMIRNGTNIAGGILTSLEQLLASEGEPRVIVLLTDGAHNAAGVSPLAAARAAAAVGVRIHSISMVSPTEGPPPEGAETMLSQVSELSGGQYFQARSAAQLNAIYLQIDRMEVAAERVIEEPIPRPERWPLASALVLMGLSGVLRGTRWGVVP
jgi:Ca-activated chloride channel family protein